MGRPTKITYEEKARDRIMVKELSHPELILKQPVEITVETEDNSYILSNDYLNVHACGESLAEALEEWQQALIGLYFSYHDTPDEQLTTGAKELKDRLQAHIEERNAQEA